MQIFDISRTEYSPDLAQKDLECFSATKRHVFLDLKILIDISSKNSQNFAIVF